MKRHCPRCGKPTAIVVTTKDTATQMGQVTEEEWRCEDCFKHFKLRSPKFDVFFLLAGVLFLGFAIAVAAGFRVKAGDRVPVALLLFAMAGGSLGYAAHALRVRKKSPPVIES